MSFQIKDGFTVDATLDASAIAQIDSSTKGVLLIPRMTEADRLAIAAPATGLMVFQTDGVSGLYYYNATWKTPAVEKTTTFASGTYTILTSDRDVVNTADNSTFTLPPATVGQEYGIWVGDYSGFVLAGDGGDLVMGESQQSLLPWSMVTVKCFVLGSWLIGR
jgi:hypothetical protein